MQYSKDIFHSMKRDLKNYFQDLKKYDKKEGENYNIERADALNNKQIAIF